jgi:hypothetical protein
MKELSRSLAKEVRDAVIAKVHRNANAVASSPHCIHCGLQWSDNRTFCGDDCRARFHFAWAARASAK